MKIFVGGLPKDISDADLLDAFKDFGEVSSAKIIADKKTGISRSYGFVEMPDRSAALRAIEALHEAVVDGQTVSVKAGVEKIVPKKAPYPKGKKPFGSYQKPAYNATKTAPPKKTGGHRKRNNGVPRNGNGTSGPVQPL